MKKIFLATAIMLGFAALLAQTPDETNETPSENSEYGLEPDTLDKPLKKSAAVAADSVKTADPVLDDDITPLPSERSENEVLFIKSLTDSKGKRRRPAVPSRDDLQPYGNDKYILPGQFYLNRGITRNIYFDVDSNGVAPIWDAEYPVESISNLIIYPHKGYGDPRLELTVVLHDYGKTDSVETTLNRLLALAEDMGCVAYWGIEKIVDGRLEGSLFLYNDGEGYDHVVRIECDPEAVIAGTGVIKGRVSLFIPTDNVDNLFAPYIKKSESEKIRYDR